MNIAPEWRATSLPPASVRSALRVDPFGPIHKGLRRHMQTVLTRMGALDVTDVTEVHGTHAAMIVLFEHLGEHLELENLYLHPVIELVQPGLTARAAADHLSHERSLVALAKAADELGRRVSLGFLAEGQAMLRSLYLHLSCFVAENLEHMHHEETELLRLLWLTHDDGQLDDLNSRLFAHASERQVRYHLTWTLFACNPCERQRLVGLARRHLNVREMKEMLEYARGRLSEPEFSVLIADLERVS